MMRPLRFELLNDVGEPQLNVPSAPQRLILTVTNLGTDRLRSFFQEATIEIRFRRGTVLDANRIHLDGHTADRWTLRHERMPDGDDVLVLMTPRVSFAPGERNEIHLLGVDADPRGGSRRTRVEIGWIGWHPPDRAEIDAHLRTSMLAMSVLRARVGDDLRGGVRSGSAAESGPFRAGLAPTATVNAPRLAADGTAHVLRLAIVNTSNQALRVSGDDDAASRIEVIVPRADIDSPWGLVNRVGDRAIVSIPIGPSSSRLRPGRLLDPQAWRIHHRQVSAVRDGIWGDRQRLELDLTVTSTVQVGGSVPVTFRYVDFPDVDDGDLTVLVDVVPTP